MIDDFKKIFLSKDRLILFSILSALYLILYFVFRYFGIERDSLNAFLNRFGYHSFLSVYLFQLVFSLTPMPDSIVTYFSVVVLGVYETFWAVYLGMLTASTVHFFIAKRFGPSLVFKIFPKMKPRIDGFKGKVDTHHLIIYRFFALISFDIVAYVAGFSDVKFRNFFVATAIGLVPVIIPNILLAHGLLTNDFWGTLVMWIITAIIVFFIAYLVKKFS